MSVKYLHKLLYSTVANLITIVLQLYRILCSYTLLFFIPIDFQNWELTAHCLLWPQPVHESHSKTVLRPHNYLYFNREGFMLLQVWINNSFEPIIFLNVNKKWNIHRFKHSLCFDRITLQLFWPDDDDLAKHDSSVYGGLTLPEKLI